MVYSRATTSAMAERVGLVAGFLVLVDISKSSQLFQSIHQSILIPLVDNILEDMSKLVVEVRDS
jgi:hypothetical protein